MKHICPICHKKTILDRDDKDDTSQDYACRTDNDHHAYFYRVRNNQMTRLKVRLNDNGVKLYLKLYCDQNRFEVWTSNLSGKRINININFVPDFSDLDKLKEKIKIYLLLS